jgi:hypothetical protein
MLIWENFLAQVISCVFGSAHSEIAHADASTPWSHLGQNGNLTVQASRSSAFAEKNVASKCISLNPHLGHLICGGSADNLSNKSLTAKYPSVDNRAMSNRTPRFQREIVLIVHTGVRHSTVWSLEKNQDRVPETAAEALGTSAATTAWPFVGCAGCAG